MHVPAKNMRLLVALAGAAGASLLAGCSGHGNHTSQAINEAEVRYAQLRSATDWEMAKQQYLAGEFTKAIKTVDSAIALNPEVEKSHTLRGRILIEEGQLEKALASLMEAHRLNPKAVEPNYYLGIVMERFNRPNEALEYYGAAMAIDPSDAQYVVASCEMLIQLGRMDEARSLLESKRDAFRFNAAVRQLEGRMAMMDNNPEAAVAAFREAQLLATDDMMLLEELAMAQMNAAQYAEAEFNFRRLIEASKTERPDLVHMRARCLMALDRPLEARTLLTDLSRTNAFDTDFSFWMDFGAVAALMNDEARLRTASSRAIAISPNRHEGYMLRAMYLRATGQFEAALDAVGKSIVRTKQDHAPLVLKSLILQDMGEFDRAMQALALASKLAPDNEPVKQFLEASREDPAFAGVDTTP